MSRSLNLLSLLILLILPVCGCGRPAPPPPGKQLRANLTRLLDHYDTRYDDDVKMLRVFFKSPGYHTRLLSGADVHPTRESLIYALGLLQRNEKGDASRAAAIIERVLALQDRKQGSRTRGTWPYLLEEPIEQMASVDMNWADFCGVQLAHMLLKHKQKLPAPLIEHMRSSLKEAVTAIRRRDVQPGYTNIAVLGAVVCAASSELFNEPKLLAYARKRMQAVVELAEKKMEFTEYNSPPYSKVVIAECERALLLVNDEAFNESADTLRELAWSIIAKSFHPPTQQWVGPHSRTSKDRLRRAMVEFLSERLPSTTIAVHETMSQGEPRGYAVVPPIDCPDVLLDQFKGPKKPTQLRRVFIPGTKKDDPGVVGISWLGKTACLGSVNKSSFWTQRKPIIGYWKTEQDPAVSIRVRFLLNGKDFASMGVLTAQEQNRVLMGFRALQNRGVWHRSLDRPENGKFSVRDLRVRIELRGKGATAVKKGPNLFALVAGDHQAVIYTSPGKFGDRPLTWTIKTGQSVAQIDGICFQHEDLKEEPKGKKRKAKSKKRDEPSPNKGATDLDLEQLSTIRLAIGLEILGPGEKPSESKLVFSQEDSIDAKWSGLALP